MAKIYGGFLACIFLFATQSSADEMSKVDQFLQSPSFDESFQAGDKGTQVLESCVFGGKCDRYSVTIDLLNFQDNQVEVRYQSGNSAPKINKMTRADWDKNQGNMLRRLFQTIRSFGQDPRVSKSELEIHQLADGTELEGLRVYFGVYNREGKLISDESALMLREFPGVMQLADYTKKQSFPIESVDRRSIGHVSRLR